MSSLEFLNRNSKNYSYNGASSQVTQLSTPGGKTENSNDAIQRIIEVQSLKADLTTNLAKFEYGYKMR